MFDGDMEQFFALESNFGLLSIKEKEDIAKKLIKGLMILHKKNILHRDIKPANILVAKDHEGYHINYTDYGISMLTSDKKSRLHTPGTLVFNSLRLWSSSYENEDPHDAEKECFQKVDDIWALGMTLYYMKFGKLPFWATSPCDAMELTIEKINEDKTFRSLKMNKSDKLGQVIWHFLRVDKQEMWTLTKALSFL